LTISARLSALRSLAAALELDARIARVKTAGARGTGRIGRQLLRQAYPRGAAVPGVEAGVTRQQLAHAIRPDHGQHPGRLRQLTPSATTAFQLLIAEGSVVESRGGDDRRHGRGRRPALLLA
jgi:hypothetical protein